MAHGVPGAVALAFCISLAACAGTKAARHGADVPPARSPEHGEPNGGRDAAYSPDGTRIAFLSSTAHTPTDLWVMDADGSRKTRLTTRGASTFRWSADGKAIHLRARRKGYDEVLSVDPAQPGGEQRVPGLPPNAGLPISSPDGSLFAFTSPGADGIHDLWVGTADRSRVEAVTEKIHVRSFFWGPDGRKIYYSPGKTYGLGLWVLDLGTMELKPLLSKYIGTPEFSATAGRVAFPYPTSPREFEIHTMALDGSGVTVRKAPRLGERWLSWAADGSAVYYLGRDEVAPAGDAAAAPAPSGPGAPHGTAKREGSRDATTGLWRLDLATGAEARASPEALHVVSASLSPDGRAALVTGLLADSRGPEVFRLDLATGDATRLTASRGSEWMPVPSPDATRIAYATQDRGLDAVRVADLAGAEVASYPGFVLEGGAKVFWLPAARGLLVFSQRGLHAFSEEGPIAFPNAKDHQALLHADVSLHDDKVALSSVPQYGESAGLYVLEAREGRFVQTDLRFPAPPERGADRYLQPRWSLDGKRLAFTDGVDVWTMSADGTARRRLTAYAEANRDGKALPSLASFPVWSVAGSRLAFTLTVYAPKTVSRELWVVEADGSSARRVFAEEVDSQFQVFLPEYTGTPFFDASDRHLIATVVHRGMPNVAAIDLATAKVTPLTETGAVFPAMLPEEDSILYTSLAGNDERIWIMNADGTGKRPFRKAVEPRGSVGEPAPAAR